MATADELIEVPYDVDGDGWNVIGEVMHRRSGLWVKQFDDAVCIESFCDAEQPLCELLTPEEARLVAGWLLRAAEECERR